MPDVTCPYCDKPAQLVGATAIYPYRHDLAHKKFYQCAPCGAWVGFLRDQCAASGTPFLWKQHGEWFPTAPEQPKPEAVRYREWHGGFTSWWVTKKRAGRLLDGVEHNGYPEVRP